MLFQSKSRMILHRVIVMALSIVLMIVVLQVGQIAKAVDDGLSYVSVNPVTDETTTISGIGIPEEDIDILVNDEVKGTVEVNSDRIWSINCASWGLTMGDTIKVSQEVSTWCKYNFYLEDEDGHEAKSTSSGQVYTFYMTIYAETYSAQYDCSLSLARSDNLKWDDSYGIQIEEILSATEMSDAEEQARRKAINESVDIDSEGLSVTLGRMWGGTGTYGTDDFNGDAYTISLKVKFVNDSKIAWNLSGSGYDDTAETKVSGDKTNITLRKIDDEGNTVSGAVFSLYSDAVVVTATSDSSGTILFQDVPTDATYTLTETTAPDGYVRNEASAQISVDEYGELLVSGELVEVDESDNWRVINPIVRTVTYKPNYDTGDDFVDEGLSAGEYTLKTHTEAGFTRSGYSFSGWNTQADGKGTAYDAGKPIELKKSMTLYAQWTKNSSGGGGGGSTTYTVTYNANGGTGSHSDSNLSSGATYTVKSQSATGIARDKYTFTSWNTKADGTGTTYAAADTFKISSNVTLYAQWKSIDDDDSLLNTEDHMAYVIGYTDGTVKPTANISRAETATIYFRLLTENARNSYWSTSNTYSDVNAENWFNNAVSTMSNANIITGYTDGTFGGNRNITRAEFAAIAARFDSSTYSGGDKFSDISGHWAAEYINRAAEKGWITGYEDGTFKPNQYITRAEAMTLINRVLGRDDIAGMHADMNTWSDNPSTAWYYEAVQEATNSHEYTRDTTTNAETYTKVTEAPDWAALEKSWSTANSV